MERIALFLLIIAMLTGLCACGTQANKQSADEPAEEIETTAAPAAQTPEPEVRAEDVLCAEDWVSHDSPWRMTWNPDGSGIAAHKYSGKQMTVFDWSIQEDGTISLITPSDRINDFTCRLTDENGATTRTMIENDAVFVQVSDYQNSEYDTAYNRLTYYEQAFIRKNALLLKMHFGAEFDPEQLTLYSVIENEKGTQIAVSDGGAIHRVSIEAGVTNGTIYYLGDYSSEAEIPDRGIFDLDAVNRALRLYFREKSAMSIAE